MFRGSVGGRAPGRQGCSVVDRVMFTIWWLLASVLAEWGVRALIHRGVYYYTASSQAQDGERAVAFILTVLTPAFTFVVVMLIYKLIRFNTAKGVATPGPHQFQTNKTFIGAWVLISIGLLTVYIISINYILGFTLSTVFYLAGQLWVFKIRRPVLLAAMPLGVTIAIYYSFVKLLNVSLPDYFSF